MRQIESLESRRLMTVTLGADPTYSDVFTFPNMGQEEQLASNDNGAWAFAYTDTATKTVKVKTGVGAVEGPVLTLGSNVIGVPEVDSSPDGKLVVGWGEQFTLKNAQNYAFKATVMDFPTGGAAPTGVRNLTFATGKGSNPDITGITVGSANVVASYRYAPPRANTTAVIQRHSLASSTASAPVTAAHAMSLETNPVDNSYIAVWHTEQSSGDVLAQRYSATGLKLGGQINVAADPTLGETHGNVDVDAAGNFVVSLAVREVVDGRAIDHTTVVAAQQVSAGGVVSPTRVIFDTGYAKTTTPDAEGNLLERRVNNAPSIDVLPDGSFIGQWSVVQTTYPAAGGYTATSQVIAQRVNASGVFVTSTSTSSPSDSFEYHHVSEEVVYLGDTDGDGIDNILGTYGIRQENSSTNGFGVRYGEILNLPPSS